MDELKSWARSVKPIDDDIPEDTLNADPNVSLEEPNDAECDDNGNGDSENNKKKKEPCCEKSNWPRDV